MDYEKLTPMMKQYMEVKDKHKDAILFYRLGDFYEMFMEDALEASKVLEIALTGRNAGLEERIPMCGVPFHAADAYIKKLIDNGYKVAICEQLEAPGQTKSIVRRDVVKIITPGTNLNLENNDYNFIMYIDAQSTNHYYLSLCDLSTGKLKAVEIVKDTQKLYNEIMSYKIKEVVVSEKFDTSIFNDLIKSYKLVISFVNTETEYSHGIIEKIDIKFQNSFLNLLKYIEAMQMVELNYYMEVEYASNDTMVIDFSSKFNLELVTTIRNNDKYGTLFWYLDKTKTAMGSRLLKEYIENPLLDVTKITQRQDFIESLLNNFMQTEQVTKYLRNIYDIARIAAKIGISTVSPKELLWLKNSLASAKLVVNELASINDDNIQAFIQSVDLVEELSDLIEDTICSNILDGDNEKIINDGVDEQLDQYRVLLNDSTTWLIDFENRQKDLTGIRNLKVKYNKVFGYYIEVSNANKALIKDEYGYTRKQTLTNAERYINSELKEQESMILSAQDNVIKVEQELFNEIKERIKEYTQRLQELSLKMAYIDVMVSLSNVSSQFGYSKPTFNNEYLVDIKESFHPIIKSIDQSTDFINNDFMMDNQTNVLLITGPNMGGKSTYMRQLSIIVIMAQIGCYVPATSANLMVFDKLFTRIGASDDLVKGQSTFMVEMLEASNAILNATKSSLILFDEIGRGTATYDGMSIACAMLEYISSKNQSKLLFSTHYHELVQLADKNSSIRNYHASVLENDNNITFTYKIKEGSIDKSYGIHVAKLANLPEAIIKRAYQLLENFEDTTTKKISNVEYVEVETDKNSDIIEMIEQADLNNMSPMNALMYLEQLKTKVAEKNE